MRPNYLHWRHPFPGERRRPPGAVGGSTFAVVFSGSVFMSGKRRPGIRLPSGPEPDGIRRIVRHEFAEDGPEPADIMQAFRLDMSLIYLL